MQKRNYAQKEKSKKPTSENDIETNEWSANQLLALPI
jgi:hypothetical protein